MSPTSPSRTKELARAASSRPVGHGALAWPPRPVGWRAFSAPEIEPRPKTGLGMVIYCCGLLNEAKKRRDPKANLFEPFTFLEHGRRLGAGGVQVPLGIHDEAYARRLRNGLPSAACSSRGSSPPRPIRPTWSASRPRSARRRWPAPPRCRTVVIPGRRYESFDLAQRFRQAAQQARALVGAGRARRRAARRPPGRREPQGPSHGRTNRAPAGDRQPVGRRRAWIWATTSPCWKTRPGWSKPWPPGPFAST